MSTTRKSAATKPRTAGDGGKSKTRAAVKPIASREFYKRVCGEDWEVIREADRAVKAFRRKVGREAFLSEWDRLHFEWSRITKRTGEEYASAKTAKLVARKFRTADNWGLLILIYCERLAAQELYDKHYPQQSKRKAA